MLSLTKELEHTFDYQGRSYELDLSFDTVLRWYEMMEDDSLEPLDKAELGFEMFFKACALDPSLLMESMEDIAGYIQQRPYGNGDSNEDSSVEPTKFYSFTQDAEAIYDSFLDQYRVDLIDQQGKLHWDKFRAMLDGLNGDTYFKRILDIRSREPGDLKGKDLTELMETKDYYMLDENRSVEAQEDRLNDIFNALAEQAK